MKATILVRDLVNLIAKHGDLDVRMAIVQGDNDEHDATVKCIDELSNNIQGVFAFEIYGEEQ